MTLTRTLAAALLLCATIILTGCTAGQARERMAQYEQAREQVTSVKATIDTVIERVEAGTQSASSALDTLREQLPDEWADRIDEYLAKGQGAIQSLMQLSALTDQTLLKLDDDVRQLKEDLANKEASDDATMELLGFVARSLPELILLLTGGGTLAGAGIALHRRGQTTGAARVAQTIAVGRAASTQFDEAISGTEAAAAMKTALATQPKRIQRAVQANRKQVAA